MLQAVSVLVSVQDIGFAVGMAAAASEQLTYVIVELPDEVTLDKGPLPPGVTLEVRVRSVARAPRGSL